jgi:hypothetical protein
MTEKFIIATMAITAITCAILLCGCSSLPPSANNTTARLFAVPQAMVMQAAGPSPGPGDVIYGHVYLNGTPVENAEVTVASIDGAYSTQDTTNASGAYVLPAPRDVELNATASYAWMRHTIWPVFAGGDYDINLYTTQKTLITGKGQVAGGHPGYNASLYNFTADVLEAIPADGSATISTKARSDGSYVLDVRPGVLYHLKGGILTTLRFNYHNTEKGGQTIDVRLEPDTTALIDYTVVLPA